MLIKYNTDPNIFEAVYITNGAR